MITSGFLASQKRLAFLALDTAGNRLATGGEDEVAIWELRNRQGVHPNWFSFSVSSVTRPDAASHQGDPLWVFVKKIPVPPPVQDREVCITSISWAALAGHILVSYLHHGIMFVVLYVEFRGSKD